MKKFLAMLLAAAMLLSFSACGASESEAGSTDVNGEALFQVLLEQVTYDSLLTDQGQVAAMFFSGMPQGATVKLYRGIDAYSDYLCLITLRSAEDRMQPVTVQPAICSSCTRRLPTTIRIKPPSLKTLPSGRAACI